MSVPITHQPATPPRNEHGVVATIILLVVQAGCALLFSGLGLFIAFISDSCGSSSTCDTDRIAIGIMTPAAVAIGFFVISLAQSIVRMRRDQSSWWVPVVWTVLSAGGVVAGFAVAASGVSSGGSLV